MKRYTTGQLVDVFDVRTELYDLWNTVKEWKNNHFSAKYSMHDSLACDVCKSYDERIWGIKMAIRRFGGRPR